MSHPNLFILIVLSMLAGCASFSPPPTERIVRTAPADQTLPCLPPDRPVTGTLGDMAEAYTETATRLRECRQRHEDLVNWVKAGESRP